ncbi:MAG: hypothetical protein IKW35_02900 [Paludibacteraceae bacterium]|nr:hypothetical protein [Paludibacteraceae bacterium]
MKIKKYILLLAFIPTLLWAKDTVIVVGGIQHEALVPVPTIEEGYYLSNSYLDLGMRWNHNNENKIGFQGLEVMTRAELTEWPMLGFQDNDNDFAGYGISHLQVGANFRWGKITVGDVYGQFGSGMVLRLYEDRALGVDNALRGGKVEINPYRGIYFTALGGKQRRYWNCYDDGAWGWNYKHDAVLGANIEFGLHEWIHQLQEAGANLTIGGSYVSKYQSSDSAYSHTVKKPEGVYDYYHNLPQWVGAGSVRAQLQMKGWNAMVEYAYKANDPTLTNKYSYAPGQALLMSLSYSQKGLAIIAQAKRSENMSFRSDPLTNNRAGSINHMTPFATQHTYMLTSLYPYGTESTASEWAFQGEIRYTWKRGTKMGGKYGTTLKLNASHIRGTTDTWFGMSEAPYYTDVNLELNKKLTKQWTIGAMAMYQTYNKNYIKDKIDGTLLHAGIGVFEAKYALNKKVQMRAEAQYMYTKQDEGQWFAALYELSLWRQLVISGQWMYNIGYGKETAEEKNYYTFAATYTHGAHRVMAGYTKTRAGFNCSGGVCRYVPKQEGVTLTYNFTW